MNDEMQLAKEILIAMMQHTQSSIGGSTPEDIPSMAKHAAMAVIEMQTILGSSVGSFDMPVLPSP